MRVSNVKKYDKSSLEERVSSTVIRDLLNDLIKLTHTEKKPGILFKSISREMNCYESAIVHHYKTPDSTAPKKVYDYLTRLKKRLSENELEITVDCHNQKMVIHFWDFEKAYNNVIGNYKIGDEKLNYILCKRFNVKNLDIEKYLGTKDVNGKKMKRVFNFLETLGDIRKMKYSASKAYDKGDYLHSIALGLGEVIEINRENMKVDFCGSINELKRAFIQREDGVMASNFSSPLHEGYSKQSW